MAKITFKGQDIHTNGELPSKGKAPDFRLVDLELNDRSLNDFKGKKLLSVNPSLDTSVCANTAKHLNDLAKSYPDLHILLISKDLPFAQKRFCAAENIKNVTTLSMMRSESFAQEYGILMEDGPLKGLTARAIVLIDENNMIVYSELVAEVTTEPNYEEIKERL